MKKTLFTLLLLTGIIGVVSAADGYRVQLKFTDRSLKDSFVYLAHYYGKPMPTIYKVDSAKFDKNNVAIFQSKDTTLGGIYIVLLSDRSTYFEFLLNNGDDMSITATSAELPVGLVFKNSPENERYVAYVKAMQDYGQKQQQHIANLAIAKMHADSVLIREAASVEARQVAAYRRNYVQKYPGTLLANIFGALEAPQVPEGIHYTPDGQVDSFFAYAYYKDHYWDKFDFRDDRLIHTPVYDAKLDEYFNRVIPQIPDSFEKEADRLIAKTRGTKEMFKYTVHTLTQMAQNSKVMGMDEAFVYLVENYYMKGDAWWLSTEMLGKYIDRAQKIAPNVLGNLAPEIKMQDLNKKEQSLSAVKAKYTLLVFWSPTCGACLTEVPKIDSLYEKVLKAKGVRIYAVRTDSDEQIWRAKIKELKLDDWINVWDPEHKSPYKSLYDVYGTPSIYLLDEKKIIRGKRIDHENIVKLIDMLEAQSSTGRK